MNSITKKLRLVLAFAFLLMMTEQASAIRFQFVYDSNYSNYWTGEVKAQIEEAGRFLSSYIKDGHGIEITISVDPNISAFAVGAPNEWLLNTDTKSIATKGSIAYSSSSLTNVSQSSIVHLTIHELMHTLGVTNSGSKSFVKHIKNGYEFHGRHAMMMNGGKVVPLSSDQSHVQRGYRDPLHVSPRISDGGGNLISALDLAILADMGYSVPSISNASAPKFVEVTLNKMYAMNFGVWVLVAMGGNDVLYGDDNDKLVLAGLGGDDVLVSGKASSEMWGDQAGGNSMGQDGSDIFYINNKSAKHSIKDFDATDKIYLSPKLGISQAEVNAAGLKAGYWQGEYSLTIGSFTLDIKSKDGQKPNIASIQIKEWTK